MGIVTPSPSCEFTLLLNWSPQPLPFSEFVEVVTPPVRLTLGIHPDLAMATLTPLLLMASCERSISGRLSSACSYTVCSSGMVAMITSSLISGITTSNPSSSVISSSCFSCNLLFISSLLASTMAYSSLARCAESWARSAFDILPTSSISLPRSSFFMLVSSICSFTFTLSSR